MSRHIVYFSSGRVGECDSQRSLTHVLIGRRDEATERPSKEIMEAPTGSLSIEDNEKLMKFMVQKTRFGRYDLHVLDWFESQEAAEAAIPSWTNHLDIAVASVNVVIP